MRKLLGSTSLRTNQSTLGHDAFIIGGDMNSSEIVLTQMVETCEKEEILSKGSHAIKPSDAKHGDILFLDIFEISFIYDLLMAGH